MIRYCVCALLCFAGMAFLGFSDALINFSASSVVGSSPESRTSAQYVAIGITVALAAIGGIFTLVDKELYKVALAFVVLVAALFSAGLTVQGTSIDYAANEHNGSIQHDRRSKNGDKINNYKSELKELRRKMKECERDNYYMPCKMTERRIAAITDKMADISDDSVSSKLAQKIDITDAIEAKSGLPAVYIERSIIFARAFAVPLLIAVLSWGFWEFVHLIFGAWKPKGSSANKEIKPQKATGSKKKSHHPSWLKAV